MTNTCHDPSGCTNPGTWHSWPWRWNPERQTTMFLCPIHWARWRRWALDFPATNALQESKAAHPANYDTIGGRASFEIWLRHEDECRCEHCEITNESLDA